MLRPKHFSFSVLSAAAGLVLGAAGLAAQKALVVCPPSDAAGCERVAQVLGGTGGGTPLFPGGVDRRYTELRTMSPGALQAYSLVFVPSFANAPYDLLREDAVREGLSLVLTGRVAVWSGTPDRGRAEGKSAGKLALIRNLARWAAADYGRSGTGLVVLQDFSDPAADGTSRRYDWIPDVAGVRVAAAPEERTYRAVRKVAGNPAGEQIAGGLAYDNMASFGLAAPAGPVRVGAVGAGGNRKDGAPVLLTFDPLAAGSGRVSYSLAPALSLSAASAPTTDILPALISYTKTSLVQARVYSSATFDAVAIDPSTVRFVIDGVLPGAAVGMMSSGAVMTVVTNLNGDGLPDRVFQFRMPDLKTAGLSGPNHQFVVQGQTASGTFQATDPTPPAVVDYPAVTRVTIVPDGGTVPVGGTVDLDAQLLAGGTAVSGRVVTWTSLDAAATVSSTGLVTGQSAGTARITAASEGKADTAVVTVTGAANAPPTATDDSYDVAEGATLEVPAPGVLGNDTDPEAGAMTAVQVSGPAHGTLSLDADGSFTYTPTAGYSGTDQFTYRANDGTSDSNVATVTITVGAVDDAPTAADDSYATSEDAALVVAAPGVLGNDTDPESDALTAVQVSGPSHGTLTLGADGSFTYTPAADYSGPDQFTYKANDGTSDSNVATVSITVNPVADAPVASDDSYATDEDAALSVPGPGVLGNDASPEGGTLSADLVTGPSHGTLSLHADGSFTYTPAADYSGPDQFTYRASDGASDSNVATVSITVNPVNDAPLAADDAYATDEDVALVVGAPGVLGNDTDPEGSTLSAVQVSGPAHGTLSLNADGSFTYTPAANYFGSDQFTYKANDGSGDGNTATVAITVNPVNDAPTANPDAFEAIGNVQVPVVAAGVLANDSDLEGDAISVTAGAITSANGGTVQMSADGSFTYVSAAGFNGSDTFSYSLSDGTATSTGTVTMTVAGRYWFVDDNAAPGGDGRQNSKFQSLTPLNGAGGSGDPDQAGDIILVHSGAYGSPIVLEESQQLIGQGIPDALTATANGQTITLLATGASPSLGAPSGNTVQLATSNTLRGLNLGNGPGSALSGSGFGTLTISNLGINTSGQALNLTNGTLSGSFAALTSTGGANNVSLASVGTGGSTVVLGTASDALSGASGDALRIDGGDGSFSFAGSITNTASLAVNVANKSGGSVTLSGPVNPAAAARGISVSGNGGGTTVSFTGNSQKISVGGAAAGVSLTNNTGATVNFSGGALAVATDDGNGFHATGGGTVTVTGANNTITSAGGVALNVANTTLGAGGLVFRSISASGGSNGIVLDNTGPTAGLTVTGSGAPGSGGTIQHTTGADGTSAGTGIYLNNTRGVGLRWMQLNDHANFAIRGSNVVGFSLARSTISGTNGSNPDQDEASVAFTGLTGAARVDTVAISGGVEDNFRVRNSGGTLDRITFTGVGIGANGAAAGNDGINLEPSGNAVMRVTIQNSTFTSARGDLFQLDVKGTASSDLVFTGNTLTNNHPNVVSGGGGVTVVGGGLGSAMTLTYNITGNTFRDAKGHGLLVSKAGGAGTLRGTVSNNQIGVAGTVNSGSQQGSGLVVLLVGGGTHTASVTGNQIRQYNNHGILLQGGDNTQGGHGTLNATVTGNTISNPGNFDPGGLAINGIHLNGGTVDVPLDQHQFCVQLSGNSLTGSGGRGGTDFRLRQRQQSTVRLPGYAGASTNTDAVVAFVRGNNGGTPSGSASANSPPGGGFVGGAACQ